MIAYEIERPEILRAHLQKGRAVYEAAMDGGGVVRWTRALDEGRDRPFDAGVGLPLYGAKSFFFPERETLFRFEKGEFRETLPAPEPFVLFGIHACDLVAIAYQDKFFRDDPYYQVRRKAALLVGLDCLEPCEGGFCPTVDAGPLVRPGTADLILQPPSRTDGTWLLLAASEAGEKSLQGFSLRLGPADWREKRAWQERNAVARFPNVPYIREGIHKINHGQVDPKTWESLGTQCFTCSGCTNLCPTCSCFATRDQKTSPASEDFERERCWDSCLFEGFQREASGHNPSATPGQRVERYWYHKFSNDYLEEFGRYGCVGCGRCERTCIGIIGVHSVMKRLTEQP